MTGTSQSQTPAVAANDFVYLLGLPTLHKFLEHLNSLAAHRPLDERKLIDRWLEANAHIQRLRTQEAGYADRHELLPLPESMASVAAAHLEVLASQRFMRTGTFQWKMVEIDRLAVYQRTINLNHIANMLAKSPAAPTDEKLIKIAVGQASAPPEVQFTQQADNVFTLASVSSDVRFLETLPLRPESVQGVQVSGNPALAIAAFIGLGANTCAALRYRNRLVLLNGSHRLYGLRARGVTHVPCLVQTISHEAELSLVRDEIRQNVHFYFGDARPPLFKDYFDPQLHMIVPMTPMKYLVQVQITHQKLRIPG